MSVVKFIFLITAAIGSASATSPRLTEVMSIAAGHEVQLHPNVTAYDICMYLATGYQYNQMGTDTNITTEAYDDHDQGIAKILTRKVNGEYDSTTEALDSYNKTQKLVNFDVADCKDVTDDEVISWYFPKTAEGADHVQDLERAKRETDMRFCTSVGQGCRRDDGSLDTEMCSSAPSWVDSVCACAEYGPGASACQSAINDGSAWITNHHRNWGSVTALMVGFKGRRGSVDKRLVGFIASKGEY